jgi:hypothetical protein
MFETDKIKQAVVAALGAIILTSTAVGAAVGPARVAETTPVSLVAAQVSGQAVA